MMEDMNLKKSPTQEMNRAAGVFHRPPTGQRGMGEIFSSKPYDS